MTINTPYFETPNGSTICRNNNNGWDVYGKGQPRTHVSIYIAKSGKSLAEVFCDENSHFSAKLNLENVPCGSLLITARCSLSSEQSQWSQNLNIVIS